jgi:hypothetical protein
LLAGKLAETNKLVKKNHKKKKNKIYYLGLSLVPFIPMDIHYLVHCYKGEIRLGKENRQFTGGFPQMGQMGQMGYPQMTGGYPGMMGGVPQTGYPGMAGGHPGMMGGYPGVPQTMGGYPYHHHHHHHHHHPHHHHHGGYPQTGYPQMPGTTQMGGYPQMPGTTQMGGYPQMPGTQMGGYPKTGTQGYGKRSN